MEKKRIIFAAALAVLTLRVMAQTFINGGTVYRQLTDSTAAVMKVSNSDYISIPNRVFNDGKAYAVTRTDRQSFYCLFNLRQISFPETLRVMAPESISNCLSLSEIVFRSSLLPQTEGNILSNIDPSSVTVIRQSGGEENVGKNVTWNGMNVVLKTCNIKNKKRKH